MPGTNPVGTYQETDYMTQSGTAYPLQIDANSAVGERSVNNFAPYPASTPAMVVYVAPGFVDQIAALGQQTVTEVAVQELAIAAAPASPNNRIDLVVIDASTGVASVVEGAPAATAAAPAIPSGSLQVAQVSVPNGTTAITASEITDLRAVWGHLPAAAGNSSGNILLAGADYGVDTSGAPNAVVAALSPAPAAYYAGQKCKIKVANANTAATTLNLNGLGAKNVVKGGTTALVGGELPAGWVADLLYDGTNFQLLNPAQLPTTPALPTLTVLRTVGTGVYTPPAGAKWLKFKVWAGGGGGAGSGSGAPSGTAGSGSYIASASATGGSGASSGTNPGAPGGAGTGTGAFNATGEQGWGYEGGNVQGVGGRGGAAFGAGQAGACGEQGVNGHDAPPNSGGGGGGAGGGNTTGIVAQAGGGGGGYSAMWGNPGAYDYQVGAGGVGGAAGSGGNPGGNGGSGLILIEEYYG